MSPPCSNAAATAPPPSGSRSTCARATPTLPFADASFDATLSVFGSMFAPDHRRTAAEILRVTRRGGTMRKISGPVRVWWSEGSGNCKEADMEAVVIRFLTPFLGALLAGTQDAAESASSRLGSTALRRAQQLWVRLWPSIGADPRSRAAAQRLARSPGDAAAQRDLQAHVNRVLRADPELDRQVHLVVREAQNSGVMATDGGVVVMGNVSAAGGGRVSIGNHVSAQNRGVAVAGDYHQQNTYADELAGSRGMALALQLIGLAIAMVGFAIAGRALFAWSHVSPSSAAAQGFPPGFGLGFAIFGAGTVTAYVGRLLKR